MKKNLLLALLLIVILTKPCLAQYSGSFVVKGDLDKFYPVVFQDLSFFSNKSTEFEIGRSIVHTDGQWRGSLISKFRIHTTNYGHGSNFIDANIRQFSPYSGPFIAGWTDATIGNGNQIVIIWLKGGTNTYYLNSPVNISPIVYDGVQNPLPHQEENGPARSYKTTIDSYVNSNGESSGGSAYYVGGSNNYFAGKVGIGTASPDEQLTVNGKVHAKEVRVDLSVPFPDYVFEHSYKLPALDSVKAFVDLNHHLPEIPSATQIEKEGLKIGEMNAVILKKVEELTLYLIGQQQQLKLQQKQIYNLHVKLQAASHKLKH